MIYVNIVCTAISAGLAVWCYGKGWYDVAGFNVFAAVFNAGIFAINL